jgi:hypothetical protein
MDESGHDIQQLKQFMHLLLSHIGLIDLQLPVWNAKAVPASTSPAGATSAAVNFLFSSFFTLFLPNFV